MENSIITSSTLNTSFDKTRYEQIFNIYKLTKDTNTSYLFFNILNKISIPDTINENLFNEFILGSKLPWTTLSYKIYGTIHLWWLIFIANKPDNIFFAEAGIKYRYILPKYLDLVLTNISQQVNK